MQINIDLETLKYLPTLIMGLSSVGIVGIPLLRKHRKKIMGEYLNENH